MVEPAKCLTALTIYFDLIFSIIFCRESLAFATEPVFASLANVLGFQDNMPYPLPADFREYSLYDVEIKYGLLQVCTKLFFRLPLFPL